MDRYKVNGRLLVDCENLAAAMPVGGSQIAAKRRSHLVDSEAGAARSRNQARNDQRPGLGA
jgi:hypothetical protein